MRQPNPDANELGGRRGVAGGDVLVRSADILNAATGFVQGESLIAGKLVSSPTMIRFGGRYSNEGGSDIATRLGDA